MNNILKVNDIVTDTNGKLARVIATHSYAEGIVVVSIKYLDSNTNKWVAANDLRKVEKFRKS